MATRWKRYWFLIGGPEIPSAPGVYVVYFGDMPVYVGQSSNVRTRFYGHNFRYGYGRNIHTPWGNVPDEQEITVKIKTPSRFGEWAMDELRLIRRLRPECNMQHLGRKRRAA